MKVTNHQKGNFSYLDSSVMYGTIEMSHKEWVESVKYLRRVYANAKRNRNTYKRDSLSQLFNWNLPKHAQDQYICLGICATELLFKRFNLPRYKRQNYQIHLAHNYTKGNKK